MRLHSTPHSTLRILSILLIGGFVATTAFAAGGEGGEGPNLFAGDIGNMIWTLVIFLLVVFVLGKFAWGPLLEKLQERERFIHDSLSDAKTEREKAQAQLDEYTKKLDEARAEATSIVEEGRRDAEVVRARVTEEAQAESDKMIERAKREIDLAKQTAVADLYSTGAQLATTVASKVIRKELNSADHERLIADAISELEQAGTN